MLNHRRADLVVSLRGYLRAKMDPADRGFDRRDLRFLGRSLEQPRETFRGGNGVIEKDEDVRGNIRSLSNYREHSGHKNPLAGAGLAASFFSIGAFLSSDRNF
jgi:hypothetical protein